MYNWFFLHLVLLSVIKISQIIEHQGHAQEEKRLNKIWWVERYLRYLIRNFEVEFEKLLNIDVYCDHKKHYKDSFYCFPRVAFVVHDLEELCQLLVNFLQQVAENTSEYNEAGAVDHFTNFYYVIFSLAVFTNGKVSNLVHNQWNNIDHEVYDNYSFNLLWSLNGRHYFFRVLLWSFKLLLQADKPKHWTVVERVNNLDCWWNVVQQCCFNSNIVQNRPNEEEKCWNSCHHDHQFRQTLNFFDRLWFDHKQRGNDNL